MKYPPPFTADDTGLDLSKTPWGAGRREAAHALAVPLPADGGDIVIRDIRMKWRYRGDTAYIFDHDRLASVTFTSAPDIRLADLKELYAVLCTQLEATYGTAVKETRPGPGGGEYYPCRKWGMDGISVAFLCFSASPPSVRLTYRPAGPYTGTAQELDALKSDIAEAVLNGYVPSDPKTNWFVPDVEVRLGDGEVALRMTRHSYLWNYYEEKHRYHYARSSGEGAVRAAIRALFAAGIDPAGQHMKITCFVYEEEGCEDLVRHYGIAQYDPPTNTVVWKRRNTVTGKAGRGPL